jgi:lysophospholipase L1-like esterase
MRRSIQLAISLSALADDGNHPNASGYEQVTQIWFAAFDPLLDS